MNTIKRNTFGLIGLSLFLSLNFNANSLTNLSPIESRKETSKTIERYFKFPQVLIPHFVPSKSNSIKVEILFTVSENGKVNFALAKTSNKELKAEIENQFLKLCFNNLKPEVINRVILNFNS